MIAVKERKVSFHTLVRRDWSTKETEKFSMIDRLIVYTCKLNKLEKKYDLGENKFCLLQSAKRDLNKNGEVIIVGFFKSATHSFRPNLIDRTTGDERKSPKKFTEGDIEKTHFAIKIASGEVFLALEMNRNGVSISQVTNYFKIFSKKFINHVNETKGKKIKKNFSLMYTKMGREDFIESVKKMNRTKAAEIHFDKALLGSQGLDFSNRTTSVQRDLILTARAEKSESITETAIDLFNSFSKSGSGISKVRVFGRDENNTSVILDTSFIEKVDSLNVSVNPETGEVSTPEMISGLKAFVNDLK